MVSTKNWKPMFGLLIHASYHADLLHCLLLFSCKAVSDSWRSHGLQHIRLPCPSLSPKVCSNSCPLSQWCHPAVSSTVHRHPLLLLPSIFSSIKVFSNELDLHMRWPKYWNFSFSIRTSNEYSGLISFRMDWLDLLAVQGTLKSLFQYHSSKTSILQHSVFFMVRTLTSVHDYRKNNSFDYHKGGVICISEFIDIFPGNLDSSLCSSSPAFHMTSSAYKLNKQGDNIQPWRPPFPILSQSVVPGLILTVASWPWPSYRFCRRQVRWSGIPTSFRIFHSLLWSKHLKTASIKQKSVFFWNSVAFSMIQWMLAIWSDSSAFSKSSFAYNTCYFKVFSSAQDFFISQSHYSVLYIKY